MFETEILIMYWNAMPKYTSKSMQYFPIVVYHVIQMKLTLWYIFEYWKYTLYRNIIEYQIFGSIKIYRIKNIAKLLVLYLITIVPKEVLQKRPCIKVYTRHSYGLKT